MKREISERFDAVMAHLKKVEPSASFDFDFRKRLEEAVARKYEETVFEKLARRTVESLRYALFPKVPVFARVAATFVILIAIGLYAYSVQPARPLLASIKGVVLVERAKDVSPREARLSERFRAGDIVAVEKNSQLDIALRGKYAIRLKEGARIMVKRLTPRYGKGTVSFELIEGMMLASIDEGFQGSEFIVGTKTATAKALGTKFAVNVSEKEKTKISVLEGKVEVESSYKPEKIILARRTVVVGAGQKTEVSANHVPLTPERLMEREWLELEELYQIGKKPQVILLIKNTPDRVKELLRPCPIYISDEKPREIPELLEKAVLKVKEAIETKDKAKHLESIKMLEEIVEKHPNPKYDVQFLLYIGAYYEYINYHEEAIKTFEKVLAEYPGSPLASLAQCAIGVIYADKLHDIDRANEAYRLVLSRYPNTLEAIFAGKMLKMKKVAQIDG